MPRSQTFLFKTFLFNFYCRSFHVPSARLHQPPLLACISRFYCTELRAYEHSCRFHLAQNEVLSARCFLFYFSDFKLLLLIKFLHNRNYTSLLCHKEVNKENNEKLVNTPLYLPLTHKGEEQRIEVKVDKSNLVLVQCEEVERNKCFKLLSSEFDPLSNAN